MLDKAIKKFLTLEINAFFRANSYVKQPYNSYNKPFEGVFFYLLYNVDSRHEEYCEVGLISGVKIFTHAQILAKTLLTDYKIGQENDVMKIYPASYSSSPIFDIRFKRNFAIAQNGYMQIYSMEEAKHFIECLKKTYFVEMFPWLEQIKTIEGLDSFLNTPIINNDLKIISSGYEGMRIDVDLMYWMRALIAARLAKNPEYHTLLSTFRSMDKDWPNKGLNELSDACNFKNGQHEPYFQRMELCFQELGI